jgi:serine/threonine protein kinase
VLTAGSLVCGYRIERLLGSGGMGAVYLAADPTLPRQTALKVLSAEHASSVRLTPLRPWSTREFITVLLPPDPYRVSKPLRFQFKGWPAARRGDYR